MEQKYIVTFIGGPADLKRIEVEHLTQWYEVPFTGESGIGFARYGLNRGVGNHVVAMWEGLRA